MRLVLVFGIWSLVFGIGLLVFGGSLLGLGIGFNDLLRQFPTLIVKMRACIFCNTPQNTQLNKLNRSDIPTSSCTALLVSAPPMTISPLPSVFTYSSLHT